MKKSLLILFVLSLFVINEGFSQSRTGLNFGLKGGINKSNVYDTEGEGFSTDAKTGVAGGIFLQIPLGTVLGLQPEVLYSEKGFKGKQVMQGKDYKFTRTMGYLDVPLLLQIKPAEWFYLVLGPQYSLLLHRKDKFTTKDFIIEGKEAIEGQDLERNTVAAVVGFDINIASFVLSGRAGWDLKKNVGSDNPYSPRYKNAWLQGTVGIRF